MKIQRYMARSMVLHLRLTITLSSVKWLLYWYWLYVGVHSPCHSSNTKEGSRNRLIIFLAPGIPTIRYYYYYFLFQKHNTVISVYLKMSMNKPISTTIEKNCLILGACVHTCTEQMWEVTKGHAYHMFQCQCWEVNYQLPTFISGWKYHWEAMSQQWKNASHDKPMTSRNFTSLLMAQLTYI